MNEIWKPVPEYEGFYEISNLGRVKALPKYRINRWGGKNLMPERFLALSGGGKLGYVNVSFCVNGRISCQWLHRLVAQVFLEPVEGKTVINHKDGNKKNNSVSNLEYCTDAENNAHAGKLNLKPIGTKHTNSKFSRDDLTKIRELLNTRKYTHKQIAKLFKVSRCTISYFAKGQTYKKEYLNNEK